MRSAVSVGLAIFIVLATVPLMPGEATARPTNATDISGSCDDTDAPTVSFGDILDAIEAFNLGTSWKSTERLTFDMVLELIAIFNGKYSGMDYPDSQTNSSLTVMVVNWQNQSINASLTLRCLERDGEPVVYERQLTLNQSGSSGDVRWITIDTGSEDGSYRLAVTTPNRSATKIVEPDEAFLVNGRVLDLDHPLGHSHYGVSITTNNTTIASCSDAIPTPPAPCARPG